MNHNEQYDFYERREYSKNAPEVKSWLDDYVKRDPAYTHWTEHLVVGNDDGTDFWLHRTNGPDQSIDLKKRAKYYADVCIETTSVFFGDAWRGPAKNIDIDDPRRSKIGWTLDPTKRTDLILWQWPSPTMSGQYIYRLDFFSLLRSTCRDHWNDWRQRYGELAAWNKGYVTLFITVPFNVVDNAIRGGQGFLI